MTLSSVDTALARHQVLSGRYEGVYGCCLQLIGIRKLHADSYTKAQWAEICRFFYFGFSIKHHHLLAPLAKIKSYLPGEDKHRAAIRFSPIAVVASTS